MVTIKGINNETILTFEIGEGSKRKRTLMQEDSVTLNFSLAQCVELKVGYYIELTSMGLWRFYIVENYKPTYNPTNSGYDYSVTFHNYYYLWQNKIFKYLPCETGQESSWSLTKRPSDFGLIIEDNLSALGYTYNGTPFVVEVDNDCDDKAIALTFNATSILSALTLIAEAVNGGNGCDWWVDGETIHIGHIENHREQAKIVFELGENVETINVANGQKSSTNRIYAYGSEKNITGKYRKELRLYPSETTNNGTYVRDSFRKVNYSMFDLDAEDYTEQAISNDLEVELKSIPASESTRTFSIKHTEYTKISDAVEVSSLYKVQVKENGGNDYFTAVTLLTTNSLNISNISCNIVIYSKKNGNYSILGTIPLSTSSIEQLHAGVVIKLNIDSNEAEYSIDKGCEVYYSIEYKFTTDNSVDTIDLIIGTMQFVKRVVTKHLELDCYDNEGNSLGEIEAILNPEGKQLGDKDSTWFNVSLPNGTSYFYPQGIRQSKVPQSYYTNKSTAENAVNAIVTKRLMLPENRYFLDMYKYQKITNGENVTINDEDVKAESELVGYATTTTTEGQLVYYKLNPMVFYGLIYSGNGFVDRKYNLSSVEVVEEVIVNDSVCPNFEMKILEAEIDRSAQEEVDGEKTNNILYVWHIRTNVKGFDDDYIIDGNKNFSITFSSGNLNGMTFEVLFLKNKTRQDAEGYTWFEIVRNDEYGIALPNDIYAPSVNDTLNLFNYDTSYIDDTLVYEAEKRLLVETLKLLAERNIDDKTYTIKLLSDWVYNSDEVRTFELGQKCSIVGYSEIDNRINSIEENLDFVYDSPTLTIGKTSSYSHFQDLQSQIDALTYKGQTYNKQSSGTNYDNRYLRKDIDDETSHKLGMAEAEVFGNAVVHGSQTIQDETNLYGDVEFGDPTDSEKKYIPNIKGGKIYWNGSGWCIDTDYLNVQKKATFKTLEIEKVTHIGGQQILTACGCIVKHVYYSSELGEYYLFFDKEDKDGKPITNDWVIGDLAYCQTFNVNEGVTQNVSNRYYWARVIGITASASNTAITDSVTGESFVPSLYHRITIKCQNVQGNNTYCDVPSNNVNGTPCIDTTRNASDTPMPNDNVVLLGHVKQQNETQAEAEARQGATLLAGAGRWGTALVMWRGIGSNANNPFTMPDADVIISPQNVKITADEMLLSSRGSLFLRSNQLTCQNIEGKKTMWLDEFGNVNIAGILNRMSFVIEGDNYPNFFHICEPLEGDDEDDFVYHAQCSDWGTYIGDTGLALYEKTFVPELFKLDGVVTLGAYSNDANENRFNMLFPFYIPVRYDDDNGSLLAVREWYDVCRTITDNGGTSHFINLAELHSLIGRKITFYNTSNVICVAYPRMMKESVQGVTGISEAYTLEGYYRYEISQGRMFTVEIVNDIVRVEEADHTPHFISGVFPLITNAEGTTPLNTTEWGID